MAVPGYRLRVSLTYVKTADAARALKAINGVLDAQGCSERAVRDGKGIALLIPGGMTEQVATALVNALTEAAATGEKSGKIAAVHTA